jgi:hypothetical protein
MPYDLTRFEMSTMVACADALRARIAGASSLEKAASEVCRFLYSELVDSSGNRACALVRSYKTHQYGTLPTDLQRFARRAFGAVAFSPPDPAMKCLTLLGTAGEESAWNERSASQGHQAIPMPTVQIVARAPMIAQLIRELGFDIAQVVRPSRDVVRDLAGKQYGVFYVDDAEGSPYIPAQQAFVIPYRIRSVVGFGGALPSGELLATILFAKVRVEPEVADRFRTVAHELNDAFATYEDESTFS